MYIYVCSDFGRACGDFVYHIFQSVKKNMFFMSRDINIFLKVYIDMIFLA